MNNDFKDIINHTIATGLFGLKEGVDFGKFEEHDWKRDSDGDIDVWALDIDNHNGPGCTRCKYSYCEHCQDGPIEPCIIELPDYTTSLGYLQVLDKLVERYPVQLSFGEEFVTGVLIYNKVIDGKDVECAIDSYGENIMMTVCYLAFNSIKGGLFK